MAKKVWGIFRKGSKGWVLVTEFNPVHVGATDHAQAQKEIVEGRLARYQKDFPHEEFRADRLSVI